MVFIWMSFSIFWSALALVTVVSDHVRHPFGDELCRDEESSTGKVRFHEIASYLEFGSNQAVQQGKCSSISSIKIPKASDSAVCPQAQASESDGKATSFHAATLGTWVGAGLSCSLRPSSVRPSPK
jgi:hypothetical protein